MGTPLQVAFLVLGPFAFIGSLVFLALFQRSLEIKEYAKFLINHPKFNKESDVIKVISYKRDDIDLHVKLFVHNEYVYVEVDRFFDLGQGKRRDPQNFKVNILNNNKTTVGYEVDSFFNWRKFVHLEYQKSLKLERTKKILDHKM